MHDALVHPDELEAAELLRRLRRARDAPDDTAAVNDLLTAIRPYLRRMAEANLHGRKADSRFDASDVTQVTLPEVVHGLGQFTGETTPTFLAWLESVLRRNVVDRIRRHLGAGMRSSGRELSLDDSEGGAQGSLRDQIPADQSTPSARLREAEQKSEFDRALAYLHGLHPEYSEVIRLKELEGLPMPEVARRMGYAGRERTFYRRHEAALNALNAYFASASRPGQTPAPPSGEQDGWEQA